MLKMKQILVGGLVLVLLMGVVGCQRDTSSVGSEVFSTGNIASGEDPMSAVSAVLEQLTEESSVAEEASSMVTQAPVVSSASSLPAATDAPSSVTTEPNSDSSVVSQAVVPESTADSFVESSASAPEQDDAPVFGGRLLSLLPESHKAVELISGTGLGLNLEKYTTIFQMDRDFDIFYSVATGEDSYYAVCRTPEQGLTYLFFTEELSITAGAVGADGRWQPFNYLVRKGGEADGELGRWLNGVWTPWEGEVTDEILQRKPYDPLAALLDDKIYEGEYEVRQAPLIRLTHAITVTGAHSYADFAGLSSENTLGDVYAIDSATQREWVLKDNPFTLHMLTDGMLVVRYVYDQEQKKFFVSKLYYYPDYVVDDSVLFFGEERGGTLYDFSILPEDRFWE